MLMPVRYNTEREQVGGAAGSTRAFLRTARASLKPAQKGAMGLWKECRERSVRFRSDSTSSSLRAPPIPSSSSSPSFYRSRREPFDINFLPTESTYLGSSMYLILAYVQHRVCVREEPVPTLRCTDCARGRFSSRQRMPASSSCPTEINGLESLGTCQTSCSTKVEPPGRLSSTVPIPMIAQCCEFPTRTESGCQSEYCRNCDR